jgi:hypothetical protein
VKRWRPGNQLEPSVGSGLIIDKKRFPRRPIKKYRRLVSRFNFLSPWSAIVHQGD